VHPGEAGRAPTAVASANAATHPGPAEGGICGTPGPAVKASEHARARGLVTTHRILVAGVAGVMLLGASAQAGAASGPVSDPRWGARLDFGGGQTPENVALEPNGSADITLAVAAQVAQVSRNGEVRVLAQLPRPAGGAACPVLGPLLGATALTVGIARDHGGSLYVALCTGSPDLQGIWRISRSGSTARVAALPAGGIPNGIALDQRRGVIYVADSLLSTVWRVTVATGAVTAWASGAQLAPDGGLGANGLKLHGGAIWVSNTQLGTLLRIPVRRDGSAGPIQTKATGLTGIDDFAFTGRGNHAPILAAVNRFNRVVLIQHDGSQQTVLTAADGLSNPSSIAIRGRTAYVLNAAYLTHTDPSVMIARLSR
jgi:sugar lactone lactonase YvrE